LWESEGRPEGSDLRHWLQAEQELGSRRSDESVRSEPSAPSPANTGNDIRPLQGTRAAAAVNRETKRGSNAPFSGDRSSLGNGNAQSAARRKPASAPAL
jgi:hypothetical protein